MGKNGVEVIAFNGKKWLNETNIKDQLKHSNLATVTLQYSSELRKQRQELQDCGNHQPCRIFLEKDFAMQIIIDCRTTPAVNFKWWIHDPIMTQEQSVLSKIATLFAAEEITLKHKLLGYRTDAYFPKYKLAIEVDQQGHNDRDIDYEIERQKAREKGLGCKFIRINQAKKVLIFLLELAKYKITLLNQLKN